MIVIAIVLSILQNNKTAKIARQKCYTFKTSAVSGVLVSLEISQCGHGGRELVIADRLTGDTISAIFTFYDELEKKGIQKGDSISKRAQSDSFFVYKKIEGRYLECCAFTTVGR